MITYKILIPLSKLGLPLSELAYRRKRRDGMKGRYWLGDEVANSTTSIDKKPAAYFVQPQWQVRLRSDDDQSLDGTFYLPSTPRKLFRRR